MGSQILLLIIGFVLTSVAGGFLGFLFQRKNWEANRRESERQASAMVFDEISRAMDRRLYRMRLLYWRLKAGDEDAIGAAMDEYRTVLREWNDSLNRNLALAYRYFGERVYGYLDGVCYQAFQALGARLEDRYRSRGDAEADPTVQLHTVGRELKALSEDVYHLNRYLVSLIQQGRVGLYQSSREDGLDRPPWKRELAPGTQSLQVARWQRDLNLLGGDQLVVDGWFGRATAEATVGFQQAQRLQPDGIVGERTRRTMDEALKGSEPEHENRS